MFLLTAICALSLSEPQDGESVRGVAQKTLRAVRSHAPMTIDGIANEEVWGRAPVGGDFTERSPRLGAKPPVKTTLRVAYDDENLYVLVESELAEGRRAKVQSLRRDSYDIFADDFIDLKIDPFRDLRSTYAFVANAAGSQYDALILEDGRVYFRRWDAVWEAQGHSVPGRFTLEYKIPFYILGIKSGEDVVMGFNVARKDPHRAADYDWKLIPPPQSMVGASGFGVLRGIKDISAPAVVELVPYALATTDFRRSFSIDPRKRPNLAAGVDARFQTGPGGYIEGSVLTDFSQVDTDEVQIANDRFPLYYPEQRPFFLNGADVFNFGHQSSAQIYFSRRIGLGGQVVPILGGLKAYARRPKFSYGVMSVQTGQGLKEDGTKKDAAHFGVARFRAQPISQLAVGIIGVGRKRFNRQGYGDAISLGLDLDLRSKDNQFRSYSFVAGVWARAEAPPTPEVTPGSGPDSTPVPVPPPTANSGWSLSNFTEYRHLYVRPSLRWLWSSPDFSAPLGFYERPNTAQHEAKLLFVPRPKWLGLRDVEVGPGFLVVTSPDYRRRLTYEGSFELKLHWKSNWHAGYFFRGTQDRIAKDFSVFGDQKVKAGLYQNRLHGFWAKTPSQKSFSGSLEFNTGRRFGGPYHRGAANFVARMGRHFILNTSYSHLWGKIQGASHRFSVGSANAQAVLSFNTRLSIDGLFRLNLTPGRELLGSQARLRWRMARGSDLFFLYANHSPLGKARSQKRAEHRLTLKFNWYTTFRLGKRRSPPPANTAPAERGHFADPFQAARWGATSR